ncbi:MAG: DUF6624 domain-containing protein [Candidatus Acidiferrales bacterium]|jgi:hypothetical protein
MNEPLRNELLSMRDEDLRVRQELLDAGELGGHYVPRMEAVHTKNASRLREIIADQGWPDEPLVGADGAEAAWLIVQHAIGEPDFQRDVLKLLRESTASNRIPAWHAAYLEDRIALYENRPQRFGTQWIDDPRDGRARPWLLADPQRVDELRAGVGLKPLAPIPGPGPDLPSETQHEMLENERWWKTWLASRGWR